MVNLNRHRVVTLTEYYTIIDYFEPNANYGGRAEIDSDGDECDDQCSYLEALFQYRNEEFWSEVEFYIENKFLENLEDFQELVPTLSSDDIDKIEMLWNAHKYNL